MLCEEFVLYVMITQKNKKICHTIYNLTNIWLWGRINIFLVFKRNRIKVL